MNALLEGQCAIVTGGTRGIGRAVAEAFLREGARVVLTGRNAEAAEATARALVAATGREVGAAIGLAADLATTDAATACVNAAVERLDGRLDILVNNAGLTRDTMALRLDEEAWDAVLDTDLKAVFFCAKAALRPMLKARCGRIVNLSSVVALTGNAGQCNYAASKAGLIGLTKSAARELAPKGIRCNAIAPGFIATDMTGGQADNPLLAQVPLGRMGAAEDVAEAAAFLAVAKYVTGEVLRVDGGIAM